MRGLWTIAAATAVLAANPAFARPDARTMSCAALNAFIAGNGAVVMTTGRHTYQRFVASGGFCDLWQLAAPVYQLTSDRKQCVVNSVCIDPAFDLPFGTESAFD